MKKALDWVINIVLTSAGVITALSWILKLRTIELITTIYTALIAIAGVGKIYLGWKFPVIDNVPFIKKFKTKPEKVIKMVENSEEFSTSFFRKLLRGGNTMKKKIIQALVYIFRANPRTSTANAAVVGAYIGLVIDLFDRYNIRKFTFDVVLHQDAYFYVWLAVFTIGLIVALIGVNGLGLESIEQWLNRVNKNALNKILDELTDIVISVPENAEFIDKSLNEGYRLLKAIQGFIREEEYTKIKNFLDDINDKLEQYYAKLELENEAKRQERLRRAQEQLSRQQSMFRPEHPDERNILKRHDQ